MKSEKWSKEEDELLKKYYTMYGIDYCIGKFNRTKRAIQLRRKKLNINVNSNIKNKYQKDNLENIVKCSKTYKECLIKLDIINFGSSYNTLKKYIKKYNISVEHFENKTISVFNFECKKNLNDILVENSNYSRVSLKERLYKEGLKERKCELCEQGEEWNGKYMSLILDHINGINNDNRIENLRIVCPNCNATLDTHGGKNIKLKYNNIIKKNEKYFCDCGNEIHKESKKCIKCQNILQRKIERPPYEELMDEINKLGYRGTGRKYNVSDSSIRKWVKYYIKNI